MYKLVNGVRKRPSEAQKHGLTTLKKAINLLGGRAVDKRTLVGRALAAWRDEIVADLGGEDNLSAQEKAIISACVHNKLLLNSVDTWLVSQPTLINTRKRQLYPIVLQRQQLQDSLIRGLTTLGLKRRSKEVSLQDYINEKYGEGDK